MTRFTHPHSRLATTRSRIVSLTALLVVGGALLALTACSAKSPSVGTALSSTVAETASAAPAGVAAAAPAAGVPVSLPNLKLTLQQKWSGFSQPLYITNAGDGSGRLFVVEQGGRIKVIVGGVVQSTPYLDLHTLTAISAATPERGLLGLAFSPNFSTDRRVYVDYTNKSGNTVVARYTASSANSSNPTWSAPTQLLHITQPYANHNGGCLQFGPDGYLYIGMGDGGSAGDPGNRAQNKSVLLGKILRIDPSKSSGTKAYSIPATNPSKLTKSSTLKPAPEVWARGVRNPWRFSFDASTTALWVADVGQDAYEEVDQVTSKQATARATKGGLNFGWHKYEGLHYYPSGKVVPVKSRSATYVWPKYNYKHPTGEAITGGYVYRGSAYPALVGTYIYADYVDGWVAGIRLRAPDGTVLASPQTRTLLTTTLSPSSFGVDENNELYLVNLKGSIYQVKGTAK